MKKNIIHNKGGIEDHLSYVERGILRLYIPKIENDITFGFIFSNSFVSVYDISIILGAMMFVWEC